ncbi:TIGR04282 family arsenosugar biosynthesis glycosyltransferase [Pseudohaliea sp.]|uniref:TIGR04282 family arsenosugar biosynthesis glycosyltransferase n=1 Tax=Pseudohaliea sp. TaxID=2740289 RepID=UPI0032EEBCD0
MADGTPPGTGEGAGGSAVERIVSARRLLQFAREPVPGRVKTRMQPVLDAAGACELHSALLTHTARQLATVDCCERELWVAGDPSHPVLAHAAALGGAAVRRQQGADLGERMLHALATALADSPRVVLVGSDCPGLDDAYVEAAFAALATADVVLGPALDGGYVLIGVRRVDALLFRGVDWSTSKVLAQTLARVDALGWRAALLEPRRDIDRPEDLAAWQQASGD